MTERMIAVVGRTGYGKSTVARQLVASRNRVIILEQDIRKAKDWAGLGVEWYHTWSELYADMITARPRRFRVGFVPTRSYFVDCLRLAWALGDATILVEEMGKYFPYRKRLKPYHMPVVDGGNMPVPGEFLELCERGRHAGPDAKSPAALIGLSQRPKRMPLCFQAELERVCAFRLTLPHDRAWLAACPGSNEDIAEQTKNLPKYRYLNITGEDGGCSLETTRP